MAKTQIRVSANNFAAANICISTEETRFYLNGVYVQPHPEKGATLVATDGHRLIAIHDEDAICVKPGIVRLDKDAMKLLAKFDGKLEVDDSGIAAFSTYRSIKSVFIDGTFPDWQRVVKPIVDGAKARFHGKPVFSIAAFNGEYIGSFAKVANLLHGDSKMIRVVSFTESDPALILFPNIPRAYGVLMPMRATNSDFAMPAWMRPILEPKPVKITKPVKKPTPKKAAKSSARRKAA